MRRAAILLVTHGVALAIGFAAGIYVLPILIEPAPPPSAEVDAAARAAEFKGTFRRDLKGSDVFHWGEGTVFVGRRQIALRGKVSPGPDYKLYLSPDYLETEEEFLRVKPRMARVGDVRTFENFVLAVPETIDPAGYTTAIVWCERFGQFISAAKYR